MHASPYENMQECIERYAHACTSTQPRVVVDLGAAGVNGSYRSLFLESETKYVGQEERRTRGSQVAHEISPSHPRR